MNDNYTNAAQLNKELNNEMRQIEFSVYLTLDPDAVPMLPMLISDAAQKLPYI